MSEEKLSFISHLEELRRRIIICLVAIAIGFGISCFFDQKLVDLLIKPLKAVLPPGSHLIFTNLSEAFLVYLKLSFLAGIVLASPVILYEIWCFIAPGLYDREKKYLLPFVIFSTLLFICGVLFAYFVALPVAFKFFVSYTTDTIRPFPSLKEYLSLTTKLLLIFGVIFEVPIFILFLSKIGILNLKILRANRKYAFLLIIVIAAIITPTGDAITLMITTLPLYLLYEISIILVRIFTRKEENPQGI